MVRLFKKQWIYPGPCMDNEGAENIRIWSRKYWYNIDERSDSEPIARDSVRFNWSIDGSDPSNQLNLVTRSNTDSSIDSKVFSFLGLPMVGLPGTHTVQYSGMVGYFECLQPGTYVEHIQCLQAWNQSSGLNLESTRLNGWLSLPDSCTSHKTQVSSYWILWQ